MAAIAHDPALLNLAAWVSETEAEGPGRRFAVWTQGCPFRCAGCCNPHYLEFKAATAMSPADLVARALESGRNVGLTFIGGEPFAQAAAVAEAGRFAHQAGLSVMVFTGYTVEQLRRAQRADWDALLGECDLLVDGAYREDQPDRERRWIGSTNQVIHFLSDRYRVLEGAWPRRGNTVEIRLDATGIHVNGFPHADVTDWIRSSLGPPRSASR